MSAIIEEEFSTEKKTTLLPVHNNDIYSYFIAIILSVFFTTVILNLWTVDLTIPFSYSGDAVFNLAFVKSIIQNGWYQVNFYLGAPYTSELYDYPMGGDNFHHFSFKVLSFFTHNPALILNLYYLLSFPLVTITSLFVFRRFNLSIGVSVLLSLLYTFLPYHFLRGTHHLFLAAYYMVPIAILIGFYILIGKQIFFKREQSNKKIRIDFSKRSIWAIIACIIIASSGVYYSFFTCLLFGIAGVIASIEKKDILTFLRTCFFCSLILLVSVINIAPNIIYNKVNGPNPMVAQRMPIEAEWYGLRIGQLLLPVSGHRIKEFASIKNKYYHLLNFNENDSATIGVLAGVGFLMLLAILIFQLGRKQELLLHLSRLNIVAILFATIGGFGAIFSLMIIPAIRGQNRISVFIAFFALFALGILLDFLLKKVKRRELKLLILSILLILGILDQTTAYYKISQEEIKKQYLADKEYFQKIEMPFSEKSMFLQLPYFSFIENGPIFEMNDYDHIKPFIHSKKFTRWSYGTSKGRKADQMVRFISSLDPEYLVETASKIGFSGIYIDRFGYGDKALGLEGKLSNLLGRSPVVSNNSRYSFFSLKGYNENQNTEKNNYISSIEKFNRYNSNGLSDGYLIDGWSASENTHRWTFKKKAEIFFPIINPNKDLELNVIMFPFITPEIKFQKVKVGINGKVIGNWIVQRDSLYKMVIKKEFLVGKKEHENFNIINLELPNAISPAKLGQSPDTRELGVALRSMYVREVE